MSQTHPFIDYLNRIEIYDCSCIQSLLNILISEMDKNFLALRNCLQSEDWENVYYVSHLMMSNAIILKNDEMIEIFKKINSIPQNERNKEIISPLLNETIKILSIELKELSKLNSGLYSLNA